MKRDLARGVLFGCMVLMLVGIIIMGGWLGVIAVVGIPSVLFGLLFLVKRAFD